MPRAISRVRRRRAVRHVERKHSVRAYLSVQELSKAGTSLTLEIHALGEKIGQLEIGRGGLFWWGGKRHKSKRLSWTDFAELMDKRAYGDA